MRKILVTLFLTGLLVLSFSSVAFGAHTPYGDRQAPTPAGYPTDTTVSLDCVSCHADATKHTSGPHGGYTDSTDRCGTCHDVHAIEGSPQLLPGATVTAVCNYCHDLTATDAGPYNTTGGMQAAAAHRVVGITVPQFTDSEGHINNTLTDGITTIPGGSGLDGSAGTLDTSMQGSLSGAVFTCNSCHTPHGVNSVNPYLGESNVKYTSRGLLAGQSKIYLTNRILKRNPNSAVISDTATEYGSAWCAGCHKGRDNSISQKHNHPVDELAPAYRFLDFAKYINGATKASVLAKGYILIDTTDPLAGTVDPLADMSADPRTNMQYAMNSIDELSGIDRGTLDGYTAISLYTNGPSCQQCHASSRDVEAKFASNINPLRGNFPHISDNKALLIEKQDDFCTNCHAPSVLP